MLEVPVYIRYGLEETVNYIANYELYYQTLDGKKELGGYLSRVPAKTFWSYFNLPVFRSLMVDPALFNNSVLMGSAQSFDRGIAPYFLDLFGVDYVVVHRVPPYQHAFNMPWLRQNPDYIIHQEEYLEKVLPMNKVYDDGKTAVYKTVYSHSTRLSITAATSPSILYLYDGWVNGLHDGSYGYALAAGKKQVILVNLRQFSGYELDLSLKPVSGVKDKAVKVGINGMELGVLTLRGGWNVYKIEIPRFLVENGINKIYFIPAATVKSKTAFKGAWPKFYLKIGYLPYPGYWEQDNSKFGQPDVSFALHDFTITRE